MELLFISGPANGQRMDIEEGRDTINICNEEDLQSHLIDHGATKPEEYKYTTYKKEQLMGNKLSFFVMAPMGMSGDDIIDTLIKGYKS